MKKTLLIAIALLVNITAFAQAGKSSSLQRPKLVVGIVVDQMRWDYLYRYYDRYQEKGFKRMLKDGFSCENTLINYVPSVTAIGHSTIYTGSVPAVHGITGNDFIIQATGKTMYCTEDSTVQTVGSSSTAGLMSPRNLLVTTVTDELRLATNFRSKVIAVALKDRGSILPGGHLANAAYWFDSKSGGFISSTYYMKELPEWVKKFNAQKLPEKYLNQDWNTLYDIDTYVQSYPDNNPYEGNYAGSTTPTFPIKTSGMYKSSYEVIRSTPYGNTITAEMAKAAIENEQLGKDNITDFLAVSFSSTDYVGHKMGVNAVETEDTYLRLDRDVADLFTFLDGKVGKDNYTVFLTADHGAAHNPNLLMDKNVPAGLWQGGKVQKALDSVLVQTFHEKDIVRSFSNSQVQLNLQIIRSAKLDESAIRKVAVDFLRQQEGIAFVADMKNLAEAALPAWLQERVINGYNSDRSGSIVMILEPAWYSGLPNATGTSHGSAYEYDTHIPLLWMGWGIKPGSTNRVTNMTDIAPTVSALLHIQAPNGNIGVPIGEVVKK
jgi:hypothetical protein